jgi:hypothetical protein
MRRRQFLAVTASAGGLSQAASRTGAAADSGPPEIPRGVWKFRFGRPEKTNQAGFSGIRFDYAGFLLGLGRTDCPADGIRCSFGEDVRAAEV